MIESQSIVLKDKQSYYHPLPVSVRFIWRVIQAHALYVNGVVGRDSRELCHLGPFVVVRQNKSESTFHNLIHIGCIEFWVTMLPAYPIS